MSGLSEFPGIFSHHLLWIKAAFSSSFSFFLISLSQICAVLPLCISLGPPDADPGLTSHDRYSGGPREEPSCPAAADERRAVSARRLHCLFF